MTEIKPITHRADSKRMPSSYRHDIDGLRAIAIVFVIIFHFYPESVPNGFLGVDIFFVISGYLIWKNSTARIKKGNYSALDFYSKRIVRLAPALAFLFFILLLMGYQLLMSHEFSLLGQETFSSSFFASNITFWSESGYFDSSANEKPLLNLWSLGVEGQFYLLFPIIIFLVAKTKNKLSFIFIFSVFLFGISIFISNSSSTAAFYLIPARLWQFTLGIFIAMIEEKEISPVNTKLHCGLDGISKYLAYILFGALCFVATLPNHNGFHGTIVTIFSGALILFSGKTNGIKILSNGAMVFLGKISYPLYLWHWPIFYFFRHVSLDLSNSAINAAAVVLSILISIFTYFFIEIPVQAFSKRKLRYTAIVLILILSFFAVIGKMAALKKIKTKSFENEMLLSEALDDWAAPIGGMRGNELIVNSIKSRTGTATLFLGDSHIEQYWPRIEHVVNSNPDGSRNALFVAWGGCPPFPETKEVGTTRPCDEFVQKAFDMANEKPEIKTVVLAAYWEWYFFGAYDRPETQKSTLQFTRASTSDPILFNQSEAEYVFQKLENEIRRLIKNGKVVVLVLSNPAGKMNNPREMLLDLKRNGKISPEIYGAERQSFIDFSRPVLDKLRAIANRTGAQIVDPVDFMCPDVKCIALHEGKPVHRDDDHIRPFYVKNHVLFLDNFILK